MVKDQRGTLFESIRTPVGVIPTNLNPRRPIIRFSKQNLLKTSIPLTQIDESARESQLSSFEDDIEIDAISSVASEDTRRSHAPDIFTIENPIEEDGDLRKHSVSAQKRRVKKVAQKKKKIRQGTQVRQKLKESFKKAKNVYKDDTNVREPYKPSKIKTAIDTIRLAVSTTGKDNVSKVGIVIDVPKLTLEKVPEVQFENDEIGVIEKQKTGQIEASMTLKQVFTKLLLKKKLTKSYLKKASDIIQDD